MSKGYKNYIVVCFLFIFISVNLTGTYFKAIQLDQEKTNANRKNDKREIAIQGGRSVPEKRPRVLIVL